MGYILPKIKQLKKYFEKRNTLFFYVVFYPTVISTIFNIFIVSDVYISESRFVVRGPERQASSGLGAFFKGAGFSRSQEDTYSVHDFMQSRDALLAINRKVSLKDVYGNKNIDIFSRFDGLKINESNEALYKYYQHNISLEIDSSSSISSLRVSAFSAQDAFQINTLLLEIGEKLVNKLNERGRQDILYSASNEVAVAEKRANTAGVALSNYRNRKSIFDPEKQSAIQLQLISKLQDEVIITENQLVQLRTFTPANPQIPSLTTRVAALKNEISQQMAKISGNGSSLTSQSTEFERLSLDKAFAEKQLGAALISLEQARSEVQRKQLYLERIVEPNKPDVAVEPRRLKNIFATLMLGLIVWGILSLFIAGIREHND